jgi:hypothetical protein
LAQEVVAYGDNDKVVIEIRLLTDQPVSARQLGEAFIALDDMFQAQLRKKYPDLSAHLAVKEVEKGSQIYQIIAVGLPTAIYASYNAMTYAIAVADFYDRVSAGVKAFIRPAASIVREDFQPESKVETKAINQLLKTIAGKRGSGLGLRKLRYREHSTETEHSTERITDVEMEFGQDDVNFASMAMDNYIDGSALPIASQAGEKQFNEVILELQQANVGPGKQGGRTGDKGIVRAVSITKECPVYFRSSIQDLKKKMIRSDENPFEMLYVVSISATLNEQGEPIAYMVTDIHDKMPR